MIRFQSSRLLASCFLSISVAVPAVVSSAAEIEVPLPQLDSSEERVRQKIRAQRGRVEAAANDAEAWGGYGMVLEAHRHLAEAMSCYRRAAELDSDEFSWHYFLAVLLEYADPAEAEAWYSRAVLLDPDYAPARVRAGENLEKLNKPMDAERHYQRAAALDPQQELAHLGLGRVALAADRLSEAVGHLERAYELSSNTQAITATLARAYHRSGQAERARQLARTARGLPRMTHHRDPRRAAVMDEAVDLESYLRRSRTYQEVGQLERARQEIENVLRIDPEHAESHFAAAGLFDLMGRPQDAERSARRAFQLNPQLLDARAVLAGSLVKQQRLDEAQREVTAVLRVEPDNFHMLVLESLLAAQKGDTVRLLRAIDRAFEVRTGDRGLRQVLSQLLVDVSASFAEVGRLVEAAESLEKALELAEEVGTPSRETQQIRAELERLRAAQG